MFVRRSGAQYVATGESFHLPAYGEAAVIAQLGRRLGARVGVTVGGNTWDIGDLGGARPVVGFRIGL